MLEIRNAKQEDKESIAHIYTLSTRSESGFDEAYCDRLVRQGSIVVAELDRRIIGFGGIDANATEQLKWLYMLPNHQRSGVGSQILQRLEQAGWKAGLTSLRLHSSPGAVNFYLKHGYRQVSQAERVGHDHEGVEMIKNRGAVN